MEHYIEKNRYDPMVLMYYDLDLVMVYAIIKGNVELVDKLLLDDRCECTSEEMYKTLAISLTCNRDMDILERMLKSPKVDFHNVAITRALEKCFLSRDINYLKISLVVLHRGIYEEVRRCVRGDIPRPIIRRIVEFLILSGRPYTPPLNKQEQDVLVDLENRYQKVIEIGASMVKLLGFSPAMEVMKYDARVYERSLFPTQTKDYQFKHFVQCVSFYVDGRSEPCQ